MIEEVEDEDEDEVKDDDRDEDKDQQDGGGQVLGFSQPCNYTPIPQNHKTQFPDPASQVRRVSANAVRREGVAGETSRQTRF